MKKIYNFYAGPGKLPESVLKRIQSEMLDYQGTGMSIIEISHRDKVVTDMIERTTNKFKEVLNLEEGDEVIFLQGGATLQFSMIPFNLCKKRSFDYVDTGYWAKKAIYTVIALGSDVNVVATSHTSIPKELKIRDNADYVHICSNNTVVGTQWFEFPKTDVPIVADMSSDLLSRKINVQDFGLIYAHAQKTLGAAGVTVVIIPKKTVRNLAKTNIEFMNYQTHIDAKSNYNTPPVFAIYTMECMLDWLQDEIGGLEEMERINIRKASMLYDFLDASEVFECPIPKEDRSLMNVVFNIKQPRLYHHLLKLAEENGIVGIKGHKSKGEDFKAGYRVSLYNAVTIEDVEYLINFLKEFIQTEIEEWSK